MKKLNRNDLGLLIIRAGIGIIFMFYGWPALLGGVKSWYGMGKAMASLGITFMPTMWGLAAACTKTFGAIALTIGFQSRIAAGLLAFVMFVALVMHVGKGDSFHVYSHALSLMIVLIGLICTGPGRYSVDAHLAK